MNRTAVMRHVINALKQITRDYRAAKELTDHSNLRVNKAIAHLSKGNMDAAGLSLLKVKEEQPQNKRFLRAMESPMLKHCLETAELTTRCDKLVLEAKAHFQEGNIEETGQALLIVLHDQPKNKSFLKFTKYQKIGDLVANCELDYQQNKSIERKRKYQQDIEKSYIDSLQWPKIQSLIEATITLGFAVIIIYYIFKHIPNK